MADQKEESKIESECDTFAKKPVDRFNYRGLVFKNGMKSMLVEDKDTNIASVSMFLCHGNNQNPPEFAGLAHFVEHLLIYQTLDCPERKFFKFIGKYGGSCNAMTDDRWMVFFFRVHSKYLEESLKHFFELFTLDPEVSFTDDMMKYEVSAVDSEFCETMNNHDQRRVRSNQLAGNDHEANKFYKGNGQSLPLTGELKKACVKYFKDFIIAPDMNLAIVSNHKCEEVKKWVNATFATIKHSTPSRYNSGDGPYSIDEKSLTIRELISACADGPDRYYRVELVFVGCDSKELSFLLTLINHCGPGSLLNELNNKLMFEQPKSGVASGDYGSISFSFTRIEPFTDEQKLSVVVMFFQYLEKVKDWVKNEMAQLSCIYNQSSTIDHFKCRYDESRGLDLVRSLSENLNKVTDQFDFEYFFDPKDTPSTFDEASAGEFLKALDQLTIHRLHLVVMNNELPVGVTKERDLIYKLDYAIVNKITKESIRDRLENDAPNFRLPSPSTLPLGHSIVLGPQSEPNSTSITNLPNGDSMFVSHRVPTQKIGIIIRRSVIKPLTDSEHILLKLYITYFKNTNGLLMDEAKFVNVTFDFEVDSFGVLMTVSGFKDKLDLFVPYLLEAFCKHTQRALNVEVFEQSKKKFIHQMKFPGGSVKDELLVKLRTLLGLIKTSEFTLSNVAFASVITQTTTFLSNSAIKLFVCGSTTISECNNMRRLCELKMNAVFPNWPNQRQPKLLSPEVMLKADKPTWYRGNESFDRATNGYLEFYQIVTNRIKDMALLSVLQFFLEQEFNETFRFSERQAPFGYTIELHSCLSSHSIGLALIIQPDSTHSFESCTAMVDKLFADFQDKLDALDPAKLEIDKKCLRDIIWDKIDGEPFDYYWPMVKVNSDFDKTPDLLYSIGRVSKEELIHFHRVHFNPSGSESCCRRIIVTLKSTYRDVPRHQPTSRDRERYDSHHLVTDISKFLVTSDMC